MDKLRLSANVHEMHGHAPTDSTSSGGPSKSSDDFPDTWIFNIEAVSTLSIAGWYVFGIFLTIWPNQAISDFYEWGSSWAIPFLLGIFYLGAGYLFQRHQKIRCFAEWRAYMRREFIVLMTPFLAFTILTLLTGSLVALEPSLRAAGLVGAMPAFSLDSLLNAIFIHPVGPVGYFVVLLGFFVLALLSKTPETGRGMWILIICALAVKGAAIAISDSGAAASLPYYLTQMMGNWIWFVLGIAICKFNLEPLLSRAGFSASMSVGFLAAIVLLKSFDVTEAAALFGLTLLGLGCAYSLSATRFLSGRQDAFFGFVTRYTMAIWLMHQIFAQATFCGLFALGFSPYGMFSDIWPPIVAVFCLIACYIFPVLVMTALSHIWKLGFIVYPARYLPQKI